VLALLSEQMPRHEWAIGVGLVFASFGTSCPDIPRTIPLIRAP
jgi:hypothetical protein